MENLITEGRYDQVTTQLSRDIVNAVKKGVKRFQTQITLFARTPVDISVYFHYNDDEPIDVSAGTYLNPKEIRKSYVNKRIVFHVNVPKDPENRLQEMNQIIPELKNIIRHEIEHVAQHKFTDREREGFFSKKRRYPQDIEYWEYLAEPYEVEAYVRGLYKKAKTQRQPLNVFLNDWWDYLESIGMEDDKIEIIRNLWTNYAKKHLPYRPDRQFGYVENFVNEALGFKPSYMKPEVNVIITFDAPDAGQDFDVMLKDILERKKVLINSISVGAGKYRPCKLDINIFDEKDIVSLINDLHRKLMVSGVRIQDVMTNFV